ncbi:MULTISPECIES: stress-responsive nuclear envelope protein [Acinetobacter calcoaceticus/baumannii complex]|jgi:chromosome segregation ATPase|uniref:stress-responsive nuclear envelope protein n=1 Tax=Acinetobacter calcoaceticus/baumannii complex TaxID=909768 RepID=UPI000453A534|nr:MULTISPECIES: stress-responsive nuclear envelope protein [Acinetobacter calcoaceticus/baumannii complex]KCY66263.1 stress-responsive nuclear envelope family protein [Acinetobacter baumannii 1288284]EXC26078.1 stress-responsive nuclear envelope family protein [Acinetobacter sp. 809848]EXE92075.1 stress-responsive nuclear envelope family protein [Acinetobacter sp. 1578804]EXS02792.1 stress-responsive nuclear envelope family protein [Acinetobacter sp. 225588]KAI0681322.1 stress-responsive nucl
MKLIYTRIAAAAALEVGTIANPDYYEYPNRSAEEVIIYGDYPKIQNDYEALDIPVEIRKLEEPVKTTLATVNVAVGITPELQEVIDQAKADCEKVVEENGQLKQKIEILEQASGDSSELISENSRLKDALLQADNATKAAEGKVVSIQAEFDAFKNDVAAMHARIAELEAGKASENPATETSTNDFENWSNDQLKEYLASKNIGYKPTASKAELLKLIPKE